MIIKKNSMAKENPVKTKNKIKITEVFQLILLLVPVYKLAKKILSDRKMK